MNLLYSIGLIIITATVFSLLIKLLKQPLIPAYVLAGLFLGPVLGIITNSEIIRTLSTIGIAFLLFVVGMEIDFNKLKNISLVASIGGLVRMLLVFFFGFMFAILYNLKSMEAVYIGIVIAFSSTMVVVKLVSDKRELDTLHARIIMGMLLMEDLVAIIILAIISTSLSLLPVLESFLKVILLLVISYFLSKVVFGKLFRFAAKSPEVLFLTSLAICFLFIALSSYLGISIIIGAFIAGVSVGNLPYSIEIASRIKPLRDFFATIFFVSLGLELSIKGLGNIFPFLLVLLFIVIILKPFITMFICSFFGYRKRTSFLTSIYLAQISEFGLIIAGVGFANRHITEDILSMVVILAVLTMALTSYFINYSDRIYNRFSRNLNFIDRFSSKKEESKQRKRYDVVLCGYNRIGYSIVKTLKKMRKKLLVVDFNPEVIERVKLLNVPAIYGDIGDIEVIAKLNFKGVKIVISTVPSKEDNILLIRKAKEKNKKVIVFVTANQIDEALELYEAGADYVILPHFLGGEHVSLLISKISSNIAKIMEIKLEHINELKRRKKLGHEHPRHD